MKIFAHLGRRRVVVSLRKAYDAGDGDGDGAGNSDWEGGVRPASVLAREPTIKPEHLLFSHHLQSVSQSPGIDTF